VSDTQRSGGADGETRPHRGPVPEEAPPQVVLEGISKAFGATQAVDGVSLEIPRGAVVGLVGENGAGKSTLARILAGVHQQDEGRLLIDGKERLFSSPNEAIASGIAMMAQEILLIPDRTVEENVLLGNMPRRGFVPDRRAIRRRFDELIERSGFDLQPALRAGSLRIADQQKVEILRAMATEARLIIMDEPSAALTADEVERLHATIADIAARGGSVLLVSHFLEEVLTITDEVVVMRDGRRISSGPTSDQSIDRLVSEMVGRELETRYEPPQAAATGPVRLSVRGLTRARVLADINIEVHAGEIVGLAGLVGAGRTEIARAIFGADPRDAGEIHIDGLEVDIRHPADAIASGIFMIPESRKDEGLLLESSITDNLLVSTLRQRARFGFVHRDRRRIAAELTERIDLRFDRLGQTVGSLSGGNQQKVLFGRALEAEPRVLIVDEPTRGVDIAAKRAIHALLEELTATGLAVLFISSELDEVLGVCNRVLVVHRGAIRAEFSPPYDDTAVLSAFFGHSEIFDA
jgi:rhamnose transport system ATP-binding protein